jgi:hypothetical protein
VLLIFASWDIWDFFWDNWLKASYPNFVVWMARSAIILCIAVKTVAVAIRVAEEVIAGQL